MRLFRPSLRLAMAVPLVLLFAATVALQAITQNKQIDQLSDRSSIRLLDALTATTRNHLSAHLEEPFRIQRDLADDLIRHNIYDEKDFGATHRFLFDVFQRRYTEQTQINVIGFGNRAGYYTGIRRNPEGNFSLMLKDASTHNELRIYATETPGATRAVVPTYDPRSRPWYTPAANSGRAGWSEIYTNQDERADIALSATSPVTRNGELLGVMVADVSLLSLNRFLHDEPMHGKGLLLIVEPDGRIVAHSETGPMFADARDTVPRRERLQIGESPSPLIQAVAKQITLPIAEISQNFKLHIDNALYYGRVSPFNDARGINWRIVALIPESELLGEARNESEQVLIWTVLLAGLGVLLLIWIINRLTAQIHHTATAAARLAQGEWDSSVGNTARLKETALLVDAFNEMSTRLQNSFARLKRQVLIDELTQVYTRRGLLEQASWTQARPALLALIGLDGFRSINDTVGFGTGDRLLQAIAARLRAQLGEDILLARIGGDEFAVLATGERAGISAEVLGDRLQARFTDPFAFGADAITLTVSIGIVGGQLNAADLPDWLRCASVALGEAKRRKRGSVVVFEATMMDESMDHARLTIELRRALERDEFIVHFQPVVDLESKRTVGAEALVRWLSPERGLVPPGSFIPVAEESDLILEIDECVLRKACSEVARRLPKLPDDFDLHVNLSPRQLIQSNFVAILKNILSESGLPATRLTLELTESQLVEEDQAVAERLRSIRALGCRIAIDDFGTGYSSLAYLSRLPFDCLKIDKCFVKKILTSSQDASIVTAILHMSWGFKVNVVAEGIETAEEAARLRSMGCPQGQGYFFGRPAPFDDLKLELTPQTVTPHT